MNTKPADETLALWMEGELEGPDLAQVEAWVADHPECLAEREALTEWRRALGSALPASEEPPYADFFNARIERSIRDGLARESIAPSRAKGFFAWRWIAPSTAAALVCFWLGTEVGGRGSGESMATAPSAAEEVPSVYTPFQGVTAEVLDSPGDEGTVIVLEGLASMPDTLELPDTAARFDESDSQLVATHSPGTF